MANPAALLLDQLARWLTPPGHSIRNVRLTAEETDEGVLEEAQRAMVHIASIEELLAGLEHSGRRIRPYREAIPRWRATVLAYPSAWDGAQTSNAFDNRHDLDILENLVDALEQTLPSYGEQDRNEMQSTLDQIREALASDDSLPLQLRRHLNGLLSHASTCLEEYELFGDFELQKAMERLLVSVNAAETVSSTPSKWQNLKEKLVYPVMVGLAIQAPDSIASIAAILPPMG